MKEKTEELRFGTSGIRGKVDLLTDIECYISAKGFIKYLIEIGHINQGETIHIAGDLRLSTDRIMLTVAKAIEDSGCQINHCGKIPSPALLYYGSLTGNASIMVTGSHIPEDRNGIKFNKKSGEVLKDDEIGIMKNIDEVRKKYFKMRNKSLFDKKGMFKVKRSLPLVNEKAREAYISRYLDVFPSDALAGLKFVLYQHSAVGRDIMKNVFNALGAEVIAPEEKIEINYICEESKKPKKEQVELRSEKFIPIDTENIRNKEKAILKELAVAYQPDAIISADGDNDRPLLANEKGNFIPGDKLGALAAMYLKPDFVAIPISANDAVVQTLKIRGCKVRQTKIGSPYVIKAMNDELLEHPERKVVGWEVNGGFLLGSDWTINNRKLQALPTRDSLLPLITTVLLAKGKNISISNLVKTSLPSWETRACIISNTTPRCEIYSPQVGKNIMQIFSPEDSNIKEVTFTITGVEALDNNGEDYSLSGATIENIKRIKKHLEQYFSKANGFDEIISINYIDGVKIAFKNREVFHLRPSGNAPEFRIYSQANNKERTEEMVRRRFEIFPLMVANEKERAVIPPS